MLQESNALEQTAFLFSKCTGWQAGRPHNGDVGGTAGRLGAGRRALANDRDTVREQKKFKSAKLSSCHAGQDLFRLRCLKRALPEQPSHGMCKSSRWRAKTPLRDGWKTKESSDEYETARSRRLRRRHSGRLPRQAPAIPAVKMPARAQRPAQPVSQSPPGQQTSKSTLRQKR
jgi:hypothetical protein